MPIYEYRCAACHHRFEVLQRLGEGGDGLVCPRCGHAEVAKQFSTFAGVAAGKSSAAADAGCGESNCCRSTSAGFT